MKTSITLLLLACLSITGSSSCSKSDSTEENSNCKTCKAFASSTSPTVEESVCSEAEEAKFRSDHKEQEISCN